MARPLRILFPDAYYHVTCRGNERKPIYRDDTDRRSFIGKLEVSCEIAFRLAFKLFKPFKRCAQFKPTFAR